jgi:drug/metabolite transporter (DMT)-like permease
MKGTETTFIAPFFYSTLVFVMILDLVFFGVIPDIISLIGSSLIVIGGLFVSLKINFKAFN